MCHFCKDRQNFSNGNSQFEGDHRFQTGVHELFGEHEIFKEILQWATLTHGKFYVKCVKYLFTLNSAAL